MRGALYRAAETGLMLLFADFEFQQQSYIHLAPSISPR